MELCLCCHHEQTCSACRVRDTSALPNPTRDKGWKSGAFQHVETMNVLFSLLVVSFYRREGSFLIDCTYTPQSAMHCAQRICFASSRSVLYTAVVE
jgi:hypothetical protein